MAVEIDGFDMVQGPVENGAEADKSVSTEIGKLEQAQGDGEAIKFGSHGDESAKAEGNGVSDSNVPKNVVEEWPAPQQTHSFYFARFRSYEDPNIKSKVDKLDKEINQKNKERIQVIEALRAKRSERAELISQIKSLRDENRQFQSVVDVKLKEIEPLQQALGKLRTANNAGRGGLCSSEEELNNIIYSLQYRIQHESIPLSEEKQILREIKQLEGTREKVIANAAMRAKVQDSIGQKEDIQDAVKLIGGNLDEMKKERQTIRSKIKQLDDALKAIDKDIQSLQEDLAAVTQKREKAFESIQQLRKQRDEGNTYFYQSRTVLNKAWDLARKKDINALEELLPTEVEKFNSLWSSDKAFRNDYEKRILPSLDTRQLSRDGRMRNRDEKPLLEEPKPAETETLPKSSVKQPKEESKPSPQEALPTQKVQKETKNKGRDLKSDLGNKDLEDADEYEFEQPRKETPTKEPAIDPAKLKEMKRQEEIEKAKQALERKRKLAEKAAAKAAIRAQKEAEKKLKEREKKAKKAAAVPNPEEPANEVAGEATEQEKLNDTIEASAPVVKEKVIKESSIRSRNRTKGPDSIPKAILKRKRSNNYWVWVASCALLVLILLVLGYIYLL
ncbi:proton pump-interactor 1-like isoform X1 [Gastrolobium bilobum]|uniref:proton pump-interactor 1-like isoform X1 n=1 Tax=Gastrolobium bilobum TaxID=150636 RepID=UPI002AAF9362|nr:proton pump-interactor 1-like isoform X1 [Gastrolobium bilobum]XP_061370258.1 proton pump-interactor 1-like isoform X1 [Gastrolobium bilobum]